MVREGLIPTILGTAVTAGGVAMKIPEMRKRNMRKEEIVPMIAAGLIGFGLAHIVLGSMDLVQER